MFYKKTNEVELAFKNVAPFAILEDLPTLEELCKHLFFTMGV